MPARIVRPLQAFAAMERRHPRSGPGRAGCAAIHDVTERWAMASIDAGRVREGLPYPLGATWDGRGVNFALFSAHATKVELCLFDSDGKVEEARLELPE